MSRIQKNTSGNNNWGKKRMKQMQREGQGAEGGITKGICLCHYRAEAVGCPPARRTLPSVDLYISARLFMTHFIRPSQATLRSPVRRCKTKQKKQPPCFRFTLISLLSGEATWDKAQATLDTSNQ